MSNMEILTHQAIQSIDGKMRDQHEIDWEQRRYEIAKELFPSIIQNIDLEATCGTAVDATIKLTDLLIEELKKEPKK